MNSTEGMNVEKYRLTRDANHPCCHEFGIVVDGRTHTDQIIEGNDETVMQKICDFLNSEAENVGNVS